MTSFSQNPALPSEASIPLFVAVARAGLAVSHGEARRLIRAGAISLNGDFVLDEMSPVKTGDIILRKAILKSASEEKELQVQSIATQDYNFARAVADNYLAFLARTSAIDELYSRHLVASQGGCNRIVGGVGHDN